MKNSQTTPRLNATAASLLGFLHERPMTGWELLKEAEERIGNFWSLTRSQVYRELNTLSVSGYVQAGERGQRERQPFTITPRGRQAFAAWLLVEPGEEIIRFPLLLYVAFAEYVPKRQLAAYVAEHRKIHASRLQQYEGLRLTSQGHDLGMGAELSLDFGVRYEQLVLDWLDKVNARVGLKIETSEG